MSRPSVLIVEDENIVAKDLQRSLDKMGYNVLGVCSSAEDAIDKANELNPDLVLMDIMLKGKLTGIEAAEDIRKNIMIPVIYLTAYADEATLNKAKITEPYGYIIKPFKEVDLRTNIEMALFKHKKEMEIFKERNIYHSIAVNKSSGESIYVKSNHQLIRIETNEIYFAEALKDYVIIYTKENRYTIHSSFKSMEKKLPESQFVRAQKSFIVRIDKIKAIDGSSIIIDHSKKYIPIGATYKNKLMSRLNLV